MIVWVSRHSEDLAFCRFVGHFALNYLDLFTRIVPFREQHVDCQLKGVVYDIIDGYSTFWGLAPSKSCCFPRYMDWCWLQLARHWGVRPTKSHSQISPCRIFYPSCWFCLLLIASSSKWYLSFSFWFSRKRHLECQLNYPNITWSFIVHSLNCLRTALFKVFFKLLEWQLVARLKFTVVVTIFLNCIVRQMDQRIEHVLSGCLVPFRWHPNIALRKEIKVVQVVDKSPHSNVEFSLFDQEWPFDILLNDKSIGLDVIGILWILTVSFSVTLHIFLKIFFEGG